jgi:hypothetical protein
MAAVSRLPAVPTSRHVAEDENPTAMALDRGGGELAGKSVNSAGLATDHSGKSVPIFGGHGSDSRGGTVRGAGKPLVGGEGSGGGGEGRAVPDRPRPAEQQERELRRAEASLLFLKRGEALKNQKQSYLTALPVMG